MSFLELNTQSLTFDQFEAFLRALLNAHPVIPLRSDGRESNLHRHDLVHRYGKQGDRQRGIDLLGVLHGGDQIVFQCKYHDPNVSRPRVGKPQAEQSIELAEEKYPEAGFYVLVTNTSFTPPAIDSLIKANWLAWGTEELHDLLRALPIVTGYHLVLDHFGPAEANRMYPLGPGLLVTPEHYQASRDDALAHKYPCVGREKEIHDLEEALTAKPRRAVILSGVGGLGKSRLLCEVLTRLQDRWTTRILQPNIEGSSAKLVALLEADQLIVGMDECHLDGFFREDVTLAVREQSKNGRLLLVTRPEGMFRLRHTLRLQGWDVIEPLQATDGLQPLDQKSMLHLATEVLGTSTRMSRHLAELSNGNPLVTVVGGEMLRESKRGIPKLVQSSEFHQRVFLHLEDSYLRQLKEPSHRRSQRLLRLLAILSPCSKEQLPEAARLLELGELELQDEIDLLRRAGLIRGSNEHFRVIPDLFSDFLVRDALVAENDFGIRSQLTESELVVKGGPAVFRNLAMARWESGSHSTNLDPIIRNLWKSYKERFSNGYDSQRSDLISSWRNWALYLPEESLELTELALEVESKPNPDRAPFAPSDLLAFRLKGIRAEAIRILSDLAKYNPDYQSRALSLLWKHRDKEPGSDQRNKPGPIAQIFGPELGRGVESSVSALKWLENEVGESKTLSKWANTRTTEPNYYLRPAFEAFLEDNYSIGNRMILSAQLVSIENTKLIRERAFSIIEMIASATPRGALNCLDLLRSIARKLHPPFGGKLESRWTDRWEKVRLKALDHLHRIVQHHPEPIIQYLARENTHDLFSRTEQNPEFQNLCEQITERIPESSEIDLFHVLLSTWHGQHFRRAKGDREDWSAIQEQWKQFCDAVATGLIETHPSGTDLGSFLDTTASTLESDGLKPQFDDLFRAVSRLDDTLCEELRVYILDHPQCHFSSHYPQLVELSQSSVSADERLSQRAVLEQSGAFIELCLHLHRHDGGNEFPKTLKALSAACKSANADQIPTILNALFPSLESGLDTLLLKSLPWHHVTTGHLNTLEKLYDPATGAGGRFPIEVYRSLLTRLDELPLESIQDVNGIIGQACQDVPAEMFKFFDRRMQRAREIRSEDDAPLMFPYLIDQNLFFTNTLSIPDYKQQAQEIFDRFRNNPGDPLWSRWFKIAVFNSSDLGMNLVLEWLHALETEEELAAVTDLIADDKARVALGMPDVVRDLLAKAREFSPATRRRVEDRLVAAVVSHGQSYENGIPEDQAVLNEARKLRQKYAADAVLHRHYDRVVRSEEADAAQELERYKQHNEGASRFR